MNGNSNNTASLDGRITYQRNGETFYIPYSLNDVANPNLQFKMGDRVKFYIAQNQQPTLQMPMGTLYARRVELINHQQQQQAQLYDSNQPKRLYRGIITTLKDSFGKIEREDLPKETFFVVDEYKGKNPAQELRLGLNVEFEIHDKTGKEIASNIKMLPEGSVCFDELSTNIYVGRIVQSPYQQNINGVLTNMGTLIYDNNDDSLVELNFTDRDRIPGANEYTLIEGDFVQFKIATDKRKRNYYLSQPPHQAFSLSSFQRATHLTLIEEHSLVDNGINTKEHRERGILFKLYSANDLLSQQQQQPNNDLYNQVKFGAIKCIEQEELVYFSFNEIINFAKFNAASSNGATDNNSGKGPMYTVDKVKLEVGDSLEFSVVKCQKVTLFIMKYVKLIKICEGLFLLKNKNKPKLFQFYYYN